MFPQYIAKCLTEPSKYLNLVEKKQIYLSLVNRCLGTGQHLKNRYGSGYLLELKLKSLSSETSGSASSTDVEVSRAERKANLIAYINRQFSSAQVQESFEDRVIFAIAQDNITSLADTFKSLEEGKVVISWRYSLKKCKQVFNEDTKNF